MIAEAPLTDPDMLEAPSYDWPWHWAMFIPILSNSLSRAWLMLAPKSQSSMASKMVDNFGIDNNSTSSAMLANKQGVCDCKPSHHIDNS